MEAEFIQTRETWEKFTNALAGASLLALATEDSSLYAYRGALCLIQAHLETRGGDAMVAVIDVLSLSRERGVGLDALWSKLAKDAVVVMHGGEYTVAALRQLGRSAFTAVADTQQAASLLGLPQTGYRSLCASLLGVDLAVGQAGDWRKRPLPAEAIAQAASDVAHLPALHRALQRRIAEAELVEEWTIAGQTVLQTSADANRADVDNAWTTKDAKSLPPTRRPLLRGLLEWRERKAREFDCPPGKVIPTRSLVALAAASVRDLDARLGEGFHSRLTYPDREDLKRLWHGLVSAGDDEAPTRTPTHDVHLSPHQTARLKRLKVWRRNEAARRHVGLQGVLPAAAMLHLARHGLAGLAEAPQLGVSRMTRYGPALSLVLSDEPT